MRAKYNGKCKQCGARILEGDECSWSRETGVLCLNCARATAPASVKMLARPVLDVRNGDRGPVFVLDLAFEQRELAKTAEFWWHEQPCKRALAGLPCKACAVNRGMGWWHFEPMKAEPLREYATPAALAVLDAHKAAVVASHAASTDADLPRPEGLDYYPFQKAGIQYALERDAVLIGDQPGLGKTIQFLGLMNADPTMHNILVVVPASIRLNWEREARRWLIRQPTNLFVVGRDGDVPPADADFVIVNYDRVIKPDVQTALMTRKWDAICLDEATAVKEETARRTKVMLGYYDKEKKERIPGVIQQAIRKVMLTGTPMLNRPIEIQSLVGALRPDVFGNRMSFAKRYCAAAQGRYGWDMSGSSNLDELGEKLRATLMVRRLKADVLKELPAKQRMVVVLDQNGCASAVRAENKAVQQMEEDTLVLRAEAEVALAGGDEEGYRRVVGELQDLAKVAFEEISLARHALAMAKLPTCLQHVDDLLEGLGDGKIAIWGHHHDVLHAVRDHFGDACVTITGETPNAERQAAVDRFQSDPTCKVFVGSIRAAGMGLTLTAASTAVFVELDWTPAIVTQAEDRHHRIGAQGNVFIQHLVVDGSLDARMAHMLVAKQEIADQMLDKAPGAVKLPIVPMGEIVKGSILADIRDKAENETTDAERRVGLLAVRMLAGVCDGAHDLDGCGFNRMDTLLGHRLAQCSTLTDGQAKLALRVCKKYHGQLPENINAEIRQALTRLAKDNHPRA